ncbi:MAG: response regulator [Thermaurantimonas sp.]|uniref:response regulator n=1 Tax=Thermaurantimonas sp. TaxID=2681568 RepID=UPI00391C2F0D
MFRILNLIFVFLLITSKSAGQVFDLTTKNYYNDYPTVLKSGWIYFPNEFYSSKQINSLKNLRGYRINADETWHKLNKAGIIESNTGYGTYYARIKLGEENPRLALKFPKIYCASKFYVNGDLYTSVGEVSKDKSSYKPALKTVFIELDPQKSKTFDIVIHVSNFDHFEGGITSPPIIGAHNYLLNINNKILITDAIILGSFLVSAIIFFFIYFMGKLSYEFISFSFFSLFFTIQYSIYKSDIFSSFFQGINYNLFIKIGVFSMMLTFSSFIIYIYYNFPKYLNKNIAFVLGFILLLFGVIGIIIPTYFITMILPAFFLGFVPVITLYLFYVFSKTVIFNERKKILSSLGAFSLLLLSFYFLNNEFHLFTSNVLIDGIIFFLFLGIHVFLLMYKYSVRIKQLYLAVEESARAKNEFISTMSHELRTPLNGIMGMASMLKTNETDPNRLNKVESIIQNTERLTSIIDDILNLSDLESGKIQLKYNKLNIREIINKSVELTNHFRKDKSIDLDILIDPTIDEVLVGDELRIKQIFVHFISNAFKFTQKGKVVISGKLLKNNDNIQEIEFSISDTGQGISKEKLNDLFNSFKQADGSHARKHGGIGLGLALAQQLINLMGGSISVKSEINKGSTFTFNILLRKADKTSIVKENTVFRKIELDPSLKLLVAEDNPVNQKLMLMMLKNLGYTADIAENGKVAVDKALSNRYDIIFMDIQMPEMDGLEATKQILKNISDRPVIIAVTANATDRDRDECLEVGMNDFVSKPVKPLEIKECILKWQGLRSFLNENKIAI